MRRELLKLSKKLKQNGMTKQSNSVLNIIRIAQVPDLMSKPDGGGGAELDPPRKKKKETIMSDMYYDALKESKESPYSKEYIAAMSFIKEYDKFSSGNTLEDEEYNRLADKYKELAQNIRNEVKAIMYTDKRHNLDGLNDMIKTVELGSQSFSSVDRPSYSMTKENSEKMGADLALKLKGLYRRISLSESEDRFDSYDSRLDKYIQEYQNLNAIGKRSVCRNLKPEVIKYFKDDRKQFLIHC